MNLKDNQIEDMAKYLITTKKNKTHTEMESDLRLTNELGDINVKIVSRWINLEDKFRFNWHIEEVKEWIEYVVFKS